MDSSPGEMEKSGLTELTGRKKSRFKQLKTRLFGKLKKKESEGPMKQSQSASDITAPEGRRDAYDSEDEFTYPQCLSSRALSHDSIFITDQTPAPEPTRVLSQDNVHSKIKDLQLKLQQQNLHLGPPPMLIPGKRLEDSGATSEDDGLPCSPPEMYFHERVMHGAVYKKHLSSLSLAGTGSEEEEQGDPFQPSSRPLSPISKPSSQPISSSASASATPPSGVDFSSPACYMPRLDTSAARHRMSVKPRNQRASTRGNRMVSLSPRHRSESISDLENVLSEEDDDETMMSTETVHHLLTMSSPTVELKEQPRQKHTETESVQDQEENLNKTESHLPSLSVEILKSEETLDPEVKVTTNPLYLQPMSINWSSGPPSPSGFSESTQPSGESLRAHSPIQRHDTNDIQIQTTENLIARESNQEEASFRQCPVPFPRAKKPKTDPPSPNGAAESESFQFVIASARNRSKTTYETNQNEGHLKGSPATHKSNPELQKDEAREMKPEFQSLLHQVQDTKSIRKEATPPAMSKPTTGANLKKTNTFTEHVETERHEDAEDRRNAFGVQLRSTSLSMKYRSEVSKMKDETKRYSLESNTAPGVSGEHAGKAESIRSVCDSNSKSKSSPPKKQDSQSLEVQLANQDNGRSSIQNTTGASKEAVSEPGWMSLAREKTRARLATNQSPVQPSPPAQPPKPALQPKTQPLHPLKTLSPAVQSSQRPAAKPTPAGAKKDKQDKGRRSAAEDDTTKKASTNSKTDVNTRAVPPNITEVAVTHTSELPASSLSSSPADVPQQQQQRPPRSDGAQPSWMELAKRKSQAWSDKTLE